MGGNSIAPNDDQEYLNGTGSTRESFEINGETLLDDRLTSLKNLVISYEMRVRGYRLQTGSNKWIAPVGRKELAGDDFITKSVGIITSYAEYVNLMTSKSADKFQMEFTDAFFKINSIMLNDDSIPHENYRAVIKMFKDTLSNVGDIIVGGREVYKKRFSGEDRPKGDGGDQF